MPQEKNVLLLGGGLSGLIAAASLAERGNYKVTVVEQAEYAGGQVRGWEDADDDPVETGIHILFPWYSNLATVYERIGKPLPLVPTGGDYRILDGKRDQIAVLETSGSIWHTLRGLMTYPTLTWRDKWACIRVVFHALTLSEKGAERYDGWTVRAYLKSRGAREGLLDLLETAAVTIQALRGWEASAASFLKFLKHLFGSQAEMAPSFLSQPTHLCMVDPLVDVITKGCGEVRLGEKIERIDFDGDRASSVVTSKTTYHDFDVLISALPAYVFRRLLPHQMQARSPQMCTFQSAYVITLQLHYDRRVFPDGEVYASNREGVLFDSVTDKAFHWKGLPSDGSIIQVLIDNSREYQASPDDLILEHALRDLQRFFPKCGEAKLLKHLVQRHTEVFTETRPNYFSGVFRNPETEITNLLAAGDWVAPPYHYGMESAAVAGLRVANELLGRDGQPTIEIDNVKFPKWTERLSRWRG